MVVNINEGILRMGEKMLRYMQSRNGFILLDVHDVVAVLNHTDDPVNREEKKQYAKGY